MPFSAYLPNLILANPPNNIPDKTSTSLYLPSFFLPIQPNFVFTKFSFQQTFFP